MKLLIGLGNPGKKYQKTRHNIGFAVLDQLAEEHGFKIGRRKFKARFAEETLFGKNICLIKPQSFMNLSGEPVFQFLNYYGIDGRDLLVVHDDIDMALGKMRFLFRSGHGGHNGVRSIIDCVGTNAFHRLKLGIGRPPEGVSPADYVLRPFEPEEVSVVEEMIRRAICAIEVFYKGK